MTTTDEVQQTLAEYERLAITSGALVQIDPPEFWSGRDNEVWAPFWMLRDAPEFGRATVHRDGVPTTVYVSWSESLPAVDEWRALWERKPMKLFGAYTLRTALRRAFRDVIGDRREPDETLDVPAPSTPAKSNRDWIVELAETSSEDAVKQLHAEAKAARAVTVDLEREIRLRLIAVKGIPIVSYTIPTKPATAAMPDPKPAAKPTQQRPVPSVMVTPADVARTLKPLTVTPPRTKKGRRAQKPKPRGPRD